MISGSPQGLTINSKDDYESPTFCQRAEQGLSPAFKVTVQKTQTSSGKEPLLDKSDSSPKQDEKSNVSTEKPKDVKNTKKEKNKKIVNMLEEYKNKKIQSKPSLNLMASITTINEATVRSKTGFLNGSESIFSQL